MTRADNLFSLAWYKVASLMPRLRAHVHVERRTYRGEHWYLLIDGISQRLHRIDRRAWAILGLCTGERSLDEIWHAVLEKTPEEAPSQAEVMDLLVRLHDAGALQVDLPPNIDHLHRQTRERQRLKRRQAMNPFAFRLEFGNPSSWLDRLDGLGRRLISPLGLLLWFAVVAAASLLAIVQAPALAAQNRGWLVDHQHLVLMWLLYPVIKGIHELAHGLAVRRFGGHVPAIGLLVMLLTPMPYVDASAASAFRYRWQRALVCAAGIMAELFLAAIALMVWISVENGLLRDVAFVTMFVGAASTLLVNGNPLVRMDGYHLLTELFDLPNLADRSRRLWLAWISKVLGVTSRSAPTAAGGEMAWLVAYAPLSWLYRAAMSVLIVTWAGMVDPWLGYLVLAAFVWLLLGLPVSQALRDLFVSTADERSQRRAGWRLLVVIASSVAVAACVPVPCATVAQGVVWLPEDAWIRPATSGFVGPVKQASGIVIEKNALITTLSDDQLRADRDAMQSRLESLEVRLHTAFREDPAVLSALQSQIASARNELERLEQRMSALAVTAPSSGQFVPMYGGDMQGRYIAQGEALGHVLPPSNRIVRVALLHQDAIGFDSDVRDIELRTADHAERILWARPRLDAPAATHRLPSRALGRAGGGELAIDTTDPEGLTSRDAIVVFDLEANEDLGDRVGTRVWVRFDHLPQTLLQQGSRKLRQLVLRQFRSVS